MTMLAVVMMGLLHAQGTAAVRVFLDCGGCYADYVRTEVRFVEFVRDRTQADVHVIVTSTETGGGGREYTLEFLGTGRFDGVNQTLRTVTTRSDTDDVIRRQIASTMRAGLLGYVGRIGLPPGFEVSVEQRRQDAQPAASARDPWKAWVFSVRGSASFEGEESIRQTELRASVSADRITPDWKITLGVDAEQRNDRFDLDDEEPVEVERRQREFDWLAVKALGEHWSAGARGAIEQSTFRNLELSLRAAPAVEFNVFPYSSYNRRQLRLLYSVGVTRNSYFEETLFGKFEETLPTHELSLTYDQRERWGSMRGRTEWFQYLNDTSKSRLEVDAGLSLRVLRGLSLSGNVRASRIRDQIALPRRGATPEEILLELRDLQSGYEYDFSVSLTYTFGSIYSAIVNPRFGQ